MTQDHTQLPWKVSYEAVNTNVLEIVGGKDRVAELNAMGVRLDNEKLFANAAFIERACNSHYELLEVVITMMDEMTRLNTVMKETWQAAEAAIAKARGQS